MYDRMYIILTNELCLVNFRFIRYIGPLFYTVLFLFFSISNKDGNIKSERIEKNDDDEKQNIDKSESCTRIQLANRLTIDINST